MSQQPSAEAGRELYETNGCANCHGREGRGDGPAAIALLTKPADLRDPSAFKRGFSEAVIARTLAEGIAAGHVLPQQLAEHQVMAMPAFGHLTELERRSIALFVISMGKTGS